MNVYKRDFVHAKGYSLKTLSGERSQHRYFENLPKMLSLRLIPLGISIAEDHLPMKIKAFSLS